MYNLFYIKNINNINDRYFKIDFPEGRYMSNINDDIITPYILDDSIPCYSNIYSDQLYKCDLRSLNTSCNPPYSSSSSYCYKTFKIQTPTSGTDVYISVYNPTESFRIYYHSPSQSYIGYDNIQNSSNYNHSYIQYLSSYTSHYLTFRNIDSGRSFITGAFQLYFTDNGTNDIIVDNNIYKYKDKFVAGKKYYIIYNDTQYNFDYYVNYDTVYTGQYNINYIIFKIPDEIPINNNTLYPIFYNENENNNSFSIDENTVTNIAGLGIEDKNDNLIINNYNVTVELKNKHVLQNYYLLKDVLFTVYDTTTNLICNIYYDSTILYKDVNIGNYDQFILNLYLLASYDVNNIYYEIQYKNNNIIIGKESEYKLFNSEGEIPLINSIISSIIQNDDNQNCLIFDKYLTENNDHFNILNVKQTFKKYSDVLDHNKLFTNKIVSMTKDIYLDNLYTNINQYHLLSTNGFYNKKNDYIYLLIQYINTDSTDLIYSKVDFVKLYNLDGTTYEISKKIEIPINIFDTTINDSIFYDDDKQYIELLTSNDTILSLYLDINNNIVQYQGNIFKTNDLEGLKYFPIKSKKTNKISLSRTGKDKINDTTYKIIYNYRIFKELFYGEYYENLMEDVNCPYTNILLSDDYEYLFFYLNNNSIIYNSNNKDLVNLYDTNYYLNYNNSIKYNKNEIIKIDNSNINLSFMDNDNIIAENNQKLDNTDYTPVISYDYINIEQLKSIKELENNIYINKEVIVLLTLKDNYLINYPKNITLYKDAGETTFLYPTNILNFDINFIDKYYKIVRFIMKNKETDLIYIHKI